MTWIDLTIRPDGEPEIEVTPTDEFEISWQLPDGGRLTLLVSREVVGKAAERTLALLAVAP